MSYVDYLKQGFEILKLDRKAISSAANDEEATKWSILTVVLTQVVVALLVTFVFAAATLGLGLVAGPVLIITMPIMALVGLFVGIGIVYLVAKLFGGQGTYMGLLRPTGLASYVTVISAIPIIGMLASIWAVVVSVVTISETQKLSIGKSIGVVVVIGVVLFLLMMILTALFAVTLLGGMGAAALAGGA